MTHSGSRQEWVQHGNIGVRGAAALLPHLERPIPTPTSEEQSAMPMLMNEGEALEVQELIAAMKAEAASTYTTLTAEVAHWKTHAEQTEQAAQAQGYAAGFVTGEVAGKVAAQAEVQTLIDTLRDLTLHHVADVQAALNAASETVAALSISIARRVVDEAFALDETLLTRRIIALVERLNDVTAATVRVHHSDLATLQRQWPGVVTTYGWGEGGPRLLGDDAVAPGGCIIEAKSHYLDAQPTTLFALVEEAFAAVPPVVQMHNLDDTTMQEAA